MKQFDKVIRKQFGIINGEKNIIFIKTGRGGTIEGFKNKYLNICDFLAETKYKFLIIFLYFLKCS